MFLRVHDNVNWERASDSPSTASCRIFVPALRTWRTRPSVLPPFIVSSKVMFLSLSMAACLLPAVGVKVC